MKTFVNGLSSLVSRSPVLVLIAALVLTLVLGAFVSQQEQASGNEGFSPDSPEFLASQVIGERFDTSSVAPVQVVFTSDTDDILTADGLRSYIGVRDAILASELAGALVEGQGGGIQGFFEPALIGMQQQGISPDVLTDDLVKQLYNGALAQLPPEVAGQITLTLSSENTDLSVPSSTAGLMIVLVDTQKIPDDPDQIKLQAAQVDMAERVAALETGSITAKPFSFALLFSDSGEFEAEIGRLFGTAFGIIMLILGYVFWTGRKGRMTAAKGVRRAAADVGLAMLVIVLSITWMNGIGVLFGPKYLGIIGNFSEILQIIPILLIGLGVDYAIHLTSRYREELSEDLSVIDSATRATKTVGIALILATVTTGVGFLTNIFSPITAIKDFGILATVGIGSAFILMLTVVPSVRILLDRRAEANDTLPTEALGASSGRLLSRMIGSTSVLAQKIPVVMLVLAIVLGGLGAWGLTRLSTEFSFTDFLPEDSPLLTTFDVLVDEFGGGLGETTNVLVEGDDLATVEVHNALVQAWGNMASTDMVLSFGQFAAAESPVSVIAQMITPPEQGGEAFNAEFAQQAFALGLQTDLTVRAGTDVGALWDAAAAANPEGMARVTAAGDSGNLEYINVAVSTQGGEAGAEGLANGLATAFTPVSDLEGITAVATNENIISRGVVTALQDSQVGSIAISLVAAMALLVLNFWFEVRRPFLGVITIAPVVLVVLWVFGMMALTGISFNPVTAMIAAIAIGIGVPYTIHITHRYEEDRERYESEGEAIRSTLTHTGGALAGSAFTTVAGFGILVTSSLTPFQQLGLVTVYAIGGALLAAVFVLPSLLILWDRWHRRRGDEVFEHAGLAELVEGEEVPVR